MNFGEAGRGTSRGPSKYEMPGAARQPRPESEDTSNPLSYYDVYTNGSRTTANSRLSTSSATKQSSKLTVSSSTLPSAALQSAYDRGAELATTAAVQIVADKMEAVSIIANYAVEPSEILHLGKLIN